MCPYCGYDISEKIHEGLNHLADDPTIYKCQKCGREYTEDEIEMGESEAE